MVDITNPVKRMPKRGASACATTVEGTLRRAPVPERAPRYTSLRVEGTPRDRGAHDLLLEETKGTLLVQKALWRAPVSTPEITPVDRTQRGAQRLTAASRRDDSLRVEANPKSCCSCLFAYSAYYSCK